MRTQLLPYFLAPFFIIEGCRSEPRALKVGASQANLIVKLEKLSAQAMDRATWTYYIEGCVGRLESQEIVGDGDIKFSSSSLHPGLTGCTFGIETNSLPNGIKVSNPAQPNLLYLAQNVTVNSDQEGQLRATATLQQLFSGLETPTGIKTFDLTLPVTFPEIETATAVTGALECAPEIPIVGQYTKTDDKSGTLRFKVALTVDEKTYTCKNLYVNADGVLQKYKAPLNLVDGRFIAKATAEVQLPTQNLERQAPVSVAPAPPAPPPAPEKVPAKHLVTVTLSPAVCTEGKVFDLSSRDCK